MSNIKYVLFDVANTLIHKPKVYENIGEVLKRHGIIIPLEKLKYHHKLLSEFIPFPDRTTREFYQNFNAELLLSFGINPETSILNEIFEACSYLPWEKFEDTDALQKLPVPFGVLSNFKSDLNILLGQLFGPVFKDIITSEETGVQKPNPKIFKFAIDRSGFNAGDILYVGDSPRLDIIPAAGMGMQVSLIDRLDIYSNVECKIGSLYDIGKML